MRLGALQEPPTWVMPAYNDGQPSRSERLRQIRVIT